MDAPGHQPPITTELKLAGRVAEFIIVTDDTLYQERVVKMGWHRIGEGSFARKLSAHQDVGRVFENFTRHVVEMIQQSARQQPVLWDVALEEFVDRVEGTDLLWWLYGSGALAARGVEIEPRSASTCPSPFACKGTFSSCPRSPRSGLSKVDHGVRRGT